MIFPDCFLSSFDDPVAYGVTYELRCGVQFEFAHYVRAVSVDCLSADAKDGGHPSGSVTLVRHSCALVGHRVGYYRQCI